LVCTQKLSRFHKWNRQEAEYHSKQHQPSRKQPMIVGRNFLSEN
jgi:hypothetical protein